MTFLGAILHFFAISLCLQVVHGDQSGTSGASLSGVFRSKVYTYHPNPNNVTFLRAVQECASRDGAVLTSIADNEEKEFLFDLLSKVTGLTHDWAYDWVWVGGFKADAHYTWLNSERRVDNLLWGTGWPMGSESDNRFCTVLRRDRRSSPWYLADNYCDGNAPFICSK